MSLKKLFNTLKEYGLRGSDSKIYIYLAKNGPLKARDICTEMKVAKQQVYPCLKNLQKRGMVNVTLEHPALFTAVPFEGVLTMFANKKIGEALDAKKRKAYFLAAWQAMTTETEFS